MREAAELLCGPFLAGFSLPDCPEFEAWVDHERARWERISRELFAPLTERAAASVPDVIPLLERLVAQSLVQRVHGQSDALRFTLLETIRTYALERLAEHGEEPAVQEAHARGLLAFAERAAPELEFKDQSVWLDRLELEQDNLRAALGWAQAHEVETRPSWPITREQTPIMAVG